MAKDTEMELDRLQKALWEAELQDDTPTRRFDPAPSEEEAYDPPRKSRGLGWLVCLFVLLTLGVLGGITWYLLRFWGYLG